MIRLAYNPASWGGWMQGLWESLECISDCGWDGVEYHYTDICEWYDRPDEFRARLADHELVLSAIYIYSRFEDADSIAQFHRQVRDAADFCASIGTEFVLIDGGNPKADSAYTDEEFQCVADAANRAGEICRQRGVQCSFHQHFGSMFEYQDAFDRLMEMTDPELVLCTPDTAQHALGDFDVVAAVRRWARRTRYIHFKDVDRKRRFIEMGRGVVDFWGCWQALQAAGFGNGSEWITCDFDYTMITPTESCRLNKTYLNKILRIEGQRDLRRPEGR